MEIGILKGRFTLELHWTFLFTLIESAITASLIWGILSWTFDLQLDYWVAVLLIMLIRAASFMVHELGHAAAFIMFKLGWNRLLLQGARISVFRETDPTAAQQVAISLLGPFAQIAFGVGTVTFSHYTGQWIVVYVTGGVVIFEGLMNMFVPMGYNSDATKLYRSIGEVMFPKRGADRDEDAEVDASL